MAEIVLTPGQRAAVESRGCALLVAAAAGSGKTRVLIDRVLDQVIREGRCVDEFLLITFTQAAAAELRGKLLAELNRESFRTEAERGALQHAARERLDIQLAPRHLAEGQEIA